MLRRYRQLRTRMHQVVDTALFMVAFWLAHILRTCWGWSHDPIGPFDDYIWLWAVILPVSPFVLEWQGVYGRPVIATRREMFWPLFKASAWVAVICILATFLVREQLARGVFPLFGAISLLLVLIKEECQRAIYRTNFGMAQLKRRVILVGRKVDSDGFRERLQRSSLPIELVAELDLNQQSIENLADQLHELSPSGVILCANHAYFPQIEKAIQICELEGVDTWLVADFFRTKTFRLSADDFHGLPVLVFSSAPEASWQAVVKQFMDVVLALLGLVVLSPLFMVLAILIKFTSKGPVLFRQQRCGLNGQPFTMYKFRTMVLDAEARQYELAARNEMSGPVFKVTNDPRITSVGQFLRKFSLDELPQIINVLRGEMSLVGPRPLPVHEVKRFDNHAFRRRLSVKPGLTCLWQISGRNQVQDFRDWVRLDLEYIDNWSLWLDIKILFKTVPVVIVGTGAK
ncbi:MAG: sugar transferase [Verrucomicrobiota bacterium]